MCCIADEIELNDVVIPNKAIIGTKFHSDDITHECTIS